MKCSTKEKTGCDPATIVISPVGVLAGGAGILVSKIPYLMVVGTYGTINTIGLNSLLVSEIDKKHGLSAKKDSQCK